MLNSREREYLKYNLKQEQAALNDLKKIYKQALDDINNQIALLMGRNDKENLSSIIYQLDYQKALKKQVSAILDTLQSKEYSRIEDYLRDCYDTGFIGSMYNIHGQGIPMMIPIDQEQVLNALTTKSKLSKSLYDSLGEDITTLKRKVSSEISRGIANNYSYADIARNLKNISNAGMNNAYRIARTEGHRIQSQSAMDAANKAKEKGADVVKQWDASLDSRTRPHHAMLDGQIKELDKPFEVAGLKAMHPSGFGIASEDINCRCALLTRARWALDDDELATLKERADYYGLDKSKDFEEFKKNYKDNLKNMENGSNNIIGSEFKRANNIKEAENYAKDVLGFEKVSYKGIDIDVANEMNKSFYDGLQYNQNIKEYLKATGSAQEINKLYKEEIKEYYYNLYKEKYPEYDKRYWEKWAIMSSNKFVCPIKSNTYAIARSGKFSDEKLKQIAAKYRGVTVNKVWGSNFNKMLDGVKSDVLDKWHPIGTDNVRAIFDHEVGHILDYTMNLSSNQSIVNLYNRLNRSEIKDGLSEYATKNIREFIAEAYSEYKNNPNPREYANTIGKIIDELSKKRG